jgi:hypothetical protein
MTLQHRDGSEVKTGDIVWQGRQSCVFLSFDGTDVHVQTTCDRRYFLRLDPQQLNLEIEHDNI